MGIVNPMKGMPRALDPKFNVATSTQHYELGFCWKDGVSEFVYVYFNEDVSQGMPVYLLDGWKVSKLPANSLAAGLIFGIQTLQSNVASTYYGFIQIRGVCTDGILVQSGASMGAPLYWQSSYLRFTTSPTSDLDCYMFKNIYTTESGGTTEGAVDGWIGL